MSLPNCTRRLSSERVSERSDSAIPLSRVVVRTVLYWAPYGTCGKISVLLEVSTSCTAIFAFTKSWVVTRADFKSDDVRRFLPSGAVTDSLRSSMEVETELRTVENSSLTAVTSCLES